MKTTAELLRDADPLGYEPRRSDMARHISRERILLLARPPASVADPRTKRRALITAATIVLLTGVAAGYWLRIAVDVVAAVRFEVHLAEDAPAAGLREAVVGGAGRRIYLHEDAVVTNSDIAHAEVTTGATETTFNVAITFNDTGTSKISRATASHLGKPLAGLIDGAVVKAPVLKGPITTSAVISGDFTRAEAERIVAGIVGR